MPGLPPTPNSMLAKHWAAKAKLAKRWRRDAYLSMRASGPIPSGVKRLSVEYTRHSSKEPDQDGLAGSTKHITDGIVDAFREKNPDFDDKASMFFATWRWEPAPRGKGRVTARIRLEDGVDD